MYDYSHEPIDETATLHMSSTKSLIDNLQQVVGAANVLTDIEDIYVYSFEHLHKEKRYTNLTAVVRVSTEEELRKVEELAQNEGVNIIRRSCWKPELGDKEASTTVLIDDVSQPELEGIGKQIRKQYLFEFGKELEANSGGFRDYAARATTPLH